MIIRPIRIEDAEAACDVLRRSIRELCAADHNNDPAILDKWLSNKTPEQMRSWIANPDARHFVSAENDRILAVGAVTKGGEILLNYVSPDARFRGVSKAMLERLEAEAAALGNKVCVLTSTATARAFYRAAGYRPAEGAPADLTSLGTRMRKALR